MLASGERERLPGRRYTAQAQGLPISGQPDEGVCSCESAGQCWLGNSRSIGQCVLMKGDLMTM
jgi:hypothetical protein